jgi:branched-chain amino acid transport system substrate-binding protein
MLGLWILLVAGLVGALPAAVPAQEPAPYRIGVNLELTGPWANITKTLVMALEMEIERINAAGGVNGHRLELVIADNGFDIAKAAANMLKFARDESILAAVGPFEDNFQATTRAIAERNRVTNIIVCPSNPQVRRLNQRWAFNIAHDDRLVTAKLIDLCRARAYRRILVFAGAWPLAQSLATHFKETGETAGLDVIISEESHRPDDIDMTPQLIKMQPVIASENIDALYLSTGGPPGPITCKNLRNLGLDIPVLGTHAFGFQFIIQLGGAAMEGVEFPTGKPVVPFQLDPADPARNVIVDFHQRMQDHYGIEADQVSGHGYDIAWLIAEALRHCQAPVTRAAFRRAFENIRGFIGCTGVYNYSPDDHNGLKKSDMIFVRIENQRFRRLKLPYFE